MCGTCGCADGRGVTVKGDDGTHTHVLADGTVVTHAHHHEAVHAHDHAHAHEHGHDHDHHHDHGSVRHDPTAVEVEVQILAKNDRLAERNRGWFLGRDVVALNLMSSPGSGKTTLLEKTLARMPSRAAVLEGDQETDADAARIRATGAKVVQINTGKGCHLEANMVWHGLQHLAPPAGTNLFIENVGNLVCPALFDLGESAKVVLFSVTEGEDKPLKYPHMFRVADLVILTKTDLLPYLDFDREKALDAVRAVNATAQLLEVSAKTGEGMDAWLQWIEEHRPPRTAGMDSQP